MPSFADSIFLFVLALLLFGPKKLPVLARELGKWVGEFRRASNEFKMQMEEELRLSEQADRQKQIAAMEAAAPIPPPLTEPEPPHIRPADILPEPAVAAAMAQSVTLEEAAAGTPPRTPPATSLDDRTTPLDDRTEPEPAAAVRPIPIASSGDLHIMPPATGLPTPRPRVANPLGDLLDSIPESAPEPALAHSGDLHTETAAHGD